MGPLRLGGKARRGRTAQLVAAALFALRDPVVVVLILIGFFTTISGKPLDGVLMLLVAGGLAWNAGIWAAAESPRPAPRSTLTAAAPLHGRRRLAFVVCGLAAAALYVTVVGSFARYSWPATAAVAGLGTVVVARGWRKPPEGSATGSPPPAGRSGAPPTFARQEAQPQPQPGRWAMSGAWPWGVLLVAGGLWELAALLQQPDLTTESQVHPTISALTDPLLASHGGRSTVLGVWLALGWFLVRR